MALPYSSRSNRLSPGRRSIGEAEIPVEMSMVPSNSCPLATSQSPDKVVVFEPGRTGTGERQNTAKQPGTETGAWHETVVPNPHLDTRLYWRPQKSWAAVCHSLRVSGRAPTATQICGCRPDGAGMAFREWTRRQRPVRQPRDKATGGFHWGIPRLRKLIVKILH